MSATNEQLVRDFCEAWSRRDVDELLTFFSPDAVYHNIPMAPVTGAEQIRNVLMLFVPSSTKIAWTIHNIASDGDLVFTERTDGFVVGEKSFDMNTFTSAFV